MSWFLLALIALLFWSGSDFFSKLGSPPEDKSSHLKMVAAVGLVMGLHALYSITFGGVSFYVEALWQYLPASLLYILAMVFGYISLRYIELSVSSPVCNASGAVAAIFCFFILGETFDFTPELFSLQNLTSGMNIFGILLVSVGVVLLGVVQMTEDKELHALRQEKAAVKYTTRLVAIVLPILYCLIDAAGTVADTLILETMDEDVANVAYEFTFLAIGCVALLLLLIKREKPKAKWEFPKLCGAVCETGGQVAYIFAIGQNPVGAAPVISAYCMLSLVWSHIFLKEKLSKKHYITIAAVIFGIVILGVAEGLAELVV